MLLEKTVALDNNFKVDSLLNFFGQIGVTSIGKNKSLLYLPDKDKENLEGTLKMEDFKKVHEELGIDDISLDKYVYFSDLRLALIFLKNENSILVVSENKSDGINSKYFHYKYQQENVKFIDASYNPYSNRILLITRGQYTSIPYEGFKNNNIVRETKYQISIVPKDKLYSIEPISESRHFIKFINKIHVQDIDKDKVVDFKDFVVFSNNKKDISKNPKSLFKFNDKLFLINSNTIEILDANSDDK